MSEKNPDLEIVGQGTTSEAAEEPAADQLAPADDGGGAEESQPADADEKVPADDGVKGVDPVNVPEQVVPEMFELGPEEAVKPIYCLQMQGRGFLEKIQGIELAGGVLVRWNSVSHFFEGARLDPREDGSYAIRT